MGRPKEMDVAESVTLRLEQKLLRVLDKLAGLRRAPRSEIIREILQKGVRNSLRESIKWCKPRAEERLEGKETVLKQRPDLFKVYEQNLGRKKVDLNVPASDARLILDVLAAHEEVEQFRRWAKDPDAALREIEEAADVPGLNEE
jgi:hypothetical protein